MSLTGPVIAIASFELEGVLCVKSAFLLSSLRRGTVRIGRSMLTRLVVGVVLEVVEDVGVRGEVKATMLC